MNEDMWGLKIGYGIHSNAVAWEEMVRPVALAWAGKFSLGKSMISRFLR